MGNVHGGLRSLCMPEVIQEQTPGNTRTVHPLQSKRKPAEQETTLAYQWAWRQWQGAI